MSLLLILSGDVSINPGPNTNLLTRSLINIRSIRNKSVAVADFINSNKSDIIAVTETWLRQEDTDSFIAIVIPPGYKCTHVPRPEGRDGGVGFFIRDDIDFKVLPQPCFNTFESISVHLSTGNAQDIVFYPTVLKGCRGIVFTHGVRMGGRAADKSLSRLYLRNRKV